MSIEQLKVNVSALTKQNFPCFDIVKDLEKEISDIEFKSKLSISDRIKKASLNQKLNQNKQKILNYYQAAKKLYLSEFSKAISTGESDEYILDIFTTGRIKGNGKVGSSFSGGYLFYWRYYPKQLRGFYSSHLSGHKDLYPYGFFKDLLKICTDCSTINYNEYDKNYTPSAVELEAINWFDDFFENIRPSLQDVIDNFITVPDFNEHEKRALKIPDKFLRAENKYTITIKAFKNYSNQLKDTERKQNREIDPAKKRLDIVDQFIATLTQKEPSGS